MKKLGKLSINPEKLIKNDELINLRGGYDEYGETFYTYKCKCGFTGGYSSQCFDVLADTLTLALQLAGTECNGQGATCSWPDCPN